jgi:hypothetical protein
MMIGIKAASKESYVTIGSIIIIVSLVLTGLCPVSAAFAEDNSSHKLILENVMFSNAAQKNITLGIRNPGNGTITVDSIFINDNLYITKTNISSFSRMEIPVSYNWTKGEHYSIFAVASNGDDNGLETTAPKNISKFQSKEGITISQSKRDLPKDSLLLLAIVALIIIILGSWWSSKKVATNSSWYKYPLGLPTGSIRAVIALLFVMAILLYAGESAQLPEWLTGIVGTIIGFYFGDRASEKAD